MSICSNVSDFLKVRNQCVDMLIDRGYALKDIPEAPPKSLISRYLSLSHEKGNSPLLDIPFEKNPICFLFENDKATPKQIQKRLLYTLQYHSIPIDTNITVVYLGNTIENLQEVERKVNQLIESVQIYNWKTLLIPIQKHVLVPKHTLVDPSKYESLLKKFNIINTSQLPAIQMTDPMARHLYMKIGDIVHIDRNGTDAYRVCVAPLE